MTPQLLYTVTDAAALMGISKTSLKELIRTHQIDSIAIPGAGRGQRHMRRIERQAIDAFIARHRQEATA